MVKGGDSMKKLLGCFFCVVLLIFGTSFSAVALTVPGGYEYLGGGGDNDDYGNVSGLVPTIDPNFHEQEINPAADHGTWTADFGAWQYLSIKAASGQATPPGGWALYFMSDSGESSGYYSTGFNGVDGVQWSGWADLGSHNVSHIRLWNNVPEPATMLLLGSGIFGLALFGRQRFKR
jgi:hypothetical protein